MFYLFRHILLTCKFNFNTFMLYKESCGNYPSVTGIHTAIKPKICTEKLSSFIVYTPNSEYKI